MRSLRPIAVLILLATPLQAQSAWLPPPVAEGAARQLAERFTELEVGSSDATEQLGAARAGVRDIAGRIDRWGLDGVLERAPELAEIDLPPTESPLLGAMASYGACALPLHPELVETQEEKAFVAIGEVAVGIVSAFLMDEFGRGGGSQKDLEAYLASDAMNQLSFEVQASAEKRNYVAAACGPMFEALFEP